MKSEKFENKEMKKAAGMVRVGAILVVVALIGLLVMGVSSAALTRTRCSSNLTL